MKKLLQSLVLLLIIFATFSCQKEKTDDSAIPHVVIENDNIQGEQDLSRFFNSKTIVVTGEDASKVSWVRNFEYFDGILCLYSGEPFNFITAINSDGNVLWKLSAKSDPLTAFSTLGEAHFDQANKNIRVFDDNKHQFYIYNFDGAFLRKEEGPKVYGINDFFATNGGRRMFSVTSYKNEFESLEKEKKAALVYFDTENNTTQPNNILLNNYHYRPEGIPFLDSQDFFRGDNGNLFYHRDFGDTLFQIKSLDLSPVVTISFNRNDKRQQILEDPKTNPLILQQFMDDNVPRPYFFLPYSNYLLLSYSYNQKEMFTMVDMKTKKTIINTRDYICNGKRFSGRLDYSNGVLLNQMYGVDYQELNGQVTDPESAVFRDNSFVYTILTPKW